MAKNIGRNNGSAKLTEAQVKRIRKDIRNDAALARVYKISRQAIFRVRTGQTWKHVS